MERGARSVNTYERTQKVKCFAASEAYDQKEMESMLKLKQFPEGAPGGKSELHSFIEDRKNEDDELLPKQHF
jgi:hypothetical protein